MSPSVEPFNEAKYKALMDGRDYKEVNLSEISLNKDLRIDSNFYTTKIKRNTNVPYVPIGTHIIRSQYGVSKDMNEDEVGYPIFRMNEIHDMFCDITTGKFVELDTAEFNEMKLNDEDVLFNRTNSYELVGRTGIYYNTGEPQTFASYLVRFITDKKYLLPEYLVAFLNSKYGVADIKRRARQSVNQTNVNPEEVKAIEIPMFDLKIFQELIKKCFIKANEKRINSQVLYDEAINILKDSFDFEMISNHGVNTTEKSLKNSFITTGRLDSEYYQEKYYKYRNRVLNHPMGYVSVSEHFDPISTKCDRTLAQYKYVEIGDVNVATKRAKANVIITEELPDNAKIMTQKGDVLVSTVRPNRGAVCILDEDEILVSGAFTVLRPKGGYSKEVLQILLCTPMYRDWLLRYNVGTSYPVIKNDNILQMIIPIFDESTQKHVEKNIQQSLSMSNESKRLVEYAKRAVEIAIEQSEETAEKWLREKVSDLEV